MGVLTLSDHGSVEYLYGVGDRSTGGEANFVCICVWPPNVGCNTYYDIDCVANQNTDTNSNTDAYTHQNSYWHCY